VKIETYVNYDGNIYITDPIIDKLVNSFIARDACEIEGDEALQEQGWGEV